MTDQDAKTVDQVLHHAEKLRIPLKALVADIGTVTTNNPIGFDFVIAKGMRRDLLQSIIESGHFGFDASTTLFGFMAGCVARRSGFSSSFREIGIGSSMHIQIGGEKGNVHIDSIGITPARDKARNNIYDFSKIVEHWDRDLRPELGPLKHFDITVVRGAMEDTGQKQLGVILSVRKKF